MVRRRAVSTAYYAVFHAIAELCTDEILPERDYDDTREFERVYRTLEHGSLKNEFSKPPMKDIEPLKEIGELVVLLQSERHRADYLPPRRRYNPVECADLIESAELAISLLEKLDVQNKRTFAVSLLFARNLP